VKNTIKIQFISFFIVLIAIIPSYGFSQDTFFQKDIINFASPLSFTISSVNVAPACFGETDGSILITCSGGLEPYSYQIDGGSFGTAGIFSDLPPGDYVVVAKDSNGQIISRDITIEENPEIVINSEDYEDISSCFGFNDGTITIDATGGFSILQYSIDGGSTYKVVPDFVELYAGTYDIMIKDGSSCYKAGSSIEINQPSQVEITSQFKTDITGCFGDNNGEIHLTAEGGTPPLNYSINSGLNFQPTGDFTNLPFGTFQLVVKDDNDCPVTLGDNFIIEQPDLLVLNDAQYSDVTTCFGGNDGSAAFQFYGGTPDVEFSVDGGLTFSDNFFIENLTAGDYYGIIRDANGCTDTLDQPNFTISEPEEVLITGFETEEPTCYGFGNGLVTINTDNGLGTMFHSVNGIDFHVNNTISGLSAGVDYTISIKDSQGCLTIGETFSLNQPDELLIDTVRVFNIEPCFGGLNGRIEIDAHGGNSGIEYSINDGANYFQEFLFTELQAGIYNVRVRDDNDCVTTYETFQLTQPDELVIINQTSHDVEGCKGSGNGEIAITAVGGTEPLLYSVDNGVTYTENGGLFDDLPQGSYEVYVKDDNGCQAHGSSFFLTDPAELFLEVTDLNTISCYGLTDGYISLNAEGGVFPYQFSINGGESYSSASTYENLVAGEYEIMVKDHFNCTIIADTIDISQPDTLKVETVGLTHVQDCFGDSTGVININATGGFQSISYSVNGGLFYIQNGGLFEDLPAKEYYITIRDENGCLFNWTDTTIIESPPELTILRAIPTEPSCKGKADGSLEIYYEGGTGISVYSIDGGNNFSENNLFTGLIAQVATIVLKDEKGCLSYPYDAFISEPNEIEILNAEPEDEICRDSGDGTITVFSFGGTSPFQYSLDNANYQNGSTFYNLIPGDYNVFIKDVNGCSADFHAITVGSPEHTAIFESDIQEGCSPLGVSFDRISDGINLGWDFGDGKTDNANNPFHNFINTSSQSRVYTTRLLGMTPQGCVDTSYQSFTVHPQPELAVLFSADTLYYPESELVITNLSTAGLENYHWDFGDESTSQEEAPGFHTYPDCGHYEIIMYASNNLCSDTTFHTLEVLPELPISKILADEVSGCTPFILNFSQESENVLTHEWNLNDGTIMTGESGFEYTYEEEGEYEVILRNDGECGTVDSDTILISVEASPYVEFEVQPKTVLPPNHPIHCYNFSEEAYSYFWDFGDGNTSDVKEPIHYYADTVGFQTVRLWVTSKNGCVDSLTIENAVEVLEYGFYGLPNAFTPNEDGLNDVYKPYAHRSIGEWEMRIYNIWGMNVFVTNDIEQGWDGRYRGDFVTDGAYVWEVTGKYATGEPFTDSGVVTLIRKKRR